MGKLKIDFTEYVNEYGSLFELKYIDELGAMRKSYERGSRDYCRACAEWLMYMTFLSLCVGNGVDLFKRAWIVWEDDDTVALNLPDGVVRARCLDGGRVEVVSPVGRIVVPACYRDAGCLAVVYQFVRMMPGEGIKGIKNPTEDDVLIGYVKLMLDDPSARERVVRAGAVLAENVGEDFLYEYLGVR